MPQDKLAIKIVLVEWSGVENDLRQGDDGTSNTPLLSANPWKLSNSFPGRLECGHTGRKKTKETEQKARKGNHY